MTKGTRMDRDDVGVQRFFPDTKLQDAIAKMMDPDVDGLPVGFKVVGRKYMKGDLDRPVDKFSGREIEITTDKEIVVRIKFDPM